MNRKDFDELKRLCEEADNPWIIYSDCLSTVYQVGDGEFEAVQLSDYIEGEANRQLIVSARAAIPELIEGIERLVEYHKAYAKNEGGKEAYDNLPDWIKEMLG